MTFALDGDVVWWAVDAKPKRTRALRRLANIATNPQVCLLVDHYDDDWRRLWWVRADGSAHIAGGRDAIRGVEHLVARYPQYKEKTPGPVVRVDVVRWRWWSAMRPP